LLSSINPSSLPNQFGCEAFDIGCETEATRHAYCGVAKDRVSPNQQNKGTSHLSPMQEEDCI
jgi:hypothetical protein